MSYLGSESFQYASLSFLRSAHDPGSFSIVHLILLFLSFYGLVCDLNPFKAFYSYIALFAAEIWPSPKLKRSYSNNKSFCAFIMIGIVSMLKFYYFSLKIWDDIHVIAHSVHFLQRPMLLSIIYDLSLLSGPPRNWANIYAIKKLLLLSFIF